MGRIIKIELDDNQRQELEEGYRKGQSHAIRTRCQMVLLKSEGRKSEDIASFLGFCQQAVNNWLKRYKAEGIKGLKVKEGRGRPAILSKTEDLEAIKKAVKNHRQRISIAKVELEETLGKEFSKRTLNRYLKILTVDINESQNV
jgi:transposase